MCLIIDCVDVLFANILMHIIQLLASIFLNTSGKWSKCDYSHSSLASSAAQSNQKKKKNADRESTERKSISECNLLSLMAITSASW